MWKQFLETTRGIVRVKNSDSANKIPARSIIRVKSSANDANGVPYFLVEKPQEDSLATSTYLFSMEIDIAADDYGHAYLPVFPALIKYDTANPVSVGDIAGPVADSYETSINGEGFFVSEVETTTNLCRLNLVTSITNTMQVVETTVLHSAGATQPCKILEGSKGAEIDTGRTVNCFNRFGDLSLSKRAIAAYVVNGWELIAAECD